eukprot:3934033-Rhodomonas_salina.1
MEIDNGDKGDKGALTWRKSSHSPSAHSLSVPPGPAWYQRIRTQYSDIAGNARDKTMVLERECTGWTSETTPRKPSDIA